MRPSPILGFAPTENAGGAARCWLARPLVLHRAMRSASLRAAPARRARVATQPGACVAARSTASTILQHNLQRSGTCCTGSNLLTMLAQMHWLLDTLPLHIFGIMRSSFST